MPRTVALGIMALILLAPLSAAILTSTAHAQPVHPHRILVINEVLERLLNKAESMAKWLGSSEAMNEIEEIKQSLTTLEELVAKGAYEEAWNLAIDLLAQARQVLRNLYLEAKTQGLLNETVEQATLTGLKQRLQALAYKLMEVAQRVGNEEALKVVEEALSLIEEGELEQARSALTTASLLLKRRGAVLMARGALIHTARWLNHTRAKSSLALLWLSAAIVKLNWVKEKLLEVNASDEAIQAVEEAVKALVDAKEHLKSLREDSLAALKALLEARDALIEAWSKVERGAAHVDHRSRPQRMVQGLGLGRPLHRRG